MREGLRPRHADQHLAKIEFWEELVLCFVQNFRELGVLGRKVSKIYEPLDSVAFSRSGTGFRSCRPREAQFRECRTQEGLCGEFNQEKVSNPGGDVRAKQQPV